MSRQLARDTDGDGAAHTSSINQKSLGKVNHCLALDCTLSACQGASKADSLGWSQV